MGTSNVNFKIEVEDGKVKLEMGEHELLIIQAALNRYTEYASENNWWDTEPGATWLVKGCIDTTARMEGFSLDKIYQTENRT